MFIFILFPSLVWSNQTGDIPIIRDVSPPQIIRGTSSARIIAGDIQDYDRIAKVWAMIYPPLETLEVNPEPIMMPLHMNQSLNQYEATWSQFKQLGTYRIAIFAEDWLGNTSLPIWTSVRLASSKQNRAILIAYGNPQDQRGASIYHSVSYMHQVLLLRGFDASQICILTDHPTAELLTQTVSFTKSNLREKIKSWAWTDTLDLLLYFAGDQVFSHYTNDSGSVILPNTLDSWLDDLQLRSPDPPQSVGIIFDMPDAGSFIPMFSPPDHVHRWIIASSSQGEATYLIRNQLLMFTKAFLGSIGAGDHLRDAFVQSQTTLNWDKIFQTPLLEMNGNSIPNEADDFSLAEQIMIGQAPYTPGSNPVIGFMQSHNTLYLPESSELIIQVSGVQGEAEIQRVFGLMVPPDSYIIDKMTAVLDEIPFTLGTGYGNYNAGYQSFIHFGSHAFAVYAEDTLGRLSSPKFGNVTYRLDLPDPYENDNDRDHAKWIYLTSMPDVGENPVNYNYIQTHNFHEQGDEDWVKFRALKGQIYSIKADPSCKNCDLVIEVYDTDGKTLLSALYINPVDRFPYGYPETARWKSPQSGIYYAKIRQCDTSISGCNVAYGVDTGYSLSFYIPEMGFDSIIWGLILPMGINAVARTEHSDYGEQDKNGYFSIPHIQGIFNLTVSAEGYLPFTTRVEVSESLEKSTEVPDIILLPMPDAPVADFRASVLKGPSPLTVQFTNLSIHSDTWLWQFGDGKTSQAHSPQIVFQTPGLYSITLESTGLGGKDQIVKKNYIDVTWPAPEASFSLSRNQGVSPLQVEFKDESKGKIETWTWDFGDGTQSTLQHPEHTYLDPGKEYTVILTVKGPGGTNQYQLDQAISVTYAPPIAQF